MILWVVVLALPILVTFAGTTLLVGALMAVILDTALLSPGSILTGIFCGLIVWLFVTVLLFKKETVLLPIENRQAFLDKLTDLFIDLGYELNLQTDDQLLFWPSFHALVLGGGVRVRLCGNSARLTGPKVYVELVRNQLRVDNQLRTTQKTLLDCRSRQGEHLLKRVEICMRVHGDRWHAMQAEFVKILEREGAEVVCEVNLLAQREEGIREDVVDFLIRDRLKKEKIPAEIHKDPMHVSGSGKSACQPVRPAAG